jgi:hypothetical protein
VKENMDMIVIGAVAGAVLVGVMPFQGVMPSLF